MRHLAAILVCGAFSAVYAASTTAAAPPKLTATVRTVSPTSRVVRIVNHDRVTYRLFRVQSFDTPKITAASKPCITRADANFNGTAVSWRYQANCAKALGPGQTFTINLTTRGSGRVDVYVVVKNVPSRIS